MSMGAIKGASQDARKRRTNDESIWSAATCRRFPTDTRYHSGDKSPHSKRAVIVRLYLTKAETEATRTSNCTQITCGRHVSRLTYHTGLLLHQSRVDGRRSGNMDTFPKL